MRQNRCSHGRCMQRVLACAVRGKSGCTDKRSCRSNSFFSLVSFDFLAVVLHFFSGPVERAPRSVLSSISVLCVSKWAFSAPLMLRRRLQTWGSLSWEPFLRHCFRESFTASTSILCPSSRDHGGRLRSPSPALSSPSSRRSPSSSCTW